MDRPRIQEMFRHKKLAVMAGGLLLLSGVAFGIARLEPGAPAVAREELYLDEVKEGTLERKVRGPGVLQPREARWLSTRVDARVDRVLVRAGETVEPDAVIVQLSNPEVERAADAAALEVAAARAEYAAARLELESQRLDRRSSLAEARASAESARLQAVAEERAFEQHAVSELQYSRSKILSAQLGERAKIEQQRLAALDSAVSAQLEARQARLRQLERAAEESRLAADSLAVKAGIAGVVQSVPVQEGQQLAPGSNVARVAKPGTLYAELRIPELDARDLAAGLPAVVDMRDRLVRGRVVRVDPAVTAGAVKVEVEFDEPLPTQARADLSVDGTIAIETLRNVRYVGRPVGAQSDSTTTVFRAKPGDSVAERVPVKFGKASVNQIVVLDGLEPGDIVALADTTQWSGKDRLVID
ncbi:MAG TPA: HlyD family efflux transporter periplasmic adaptor subunit [Steroidobacteraceae bacterium]|jgi:HlyD family secretion protein|nr:HlyD family efflux transporter periplasmic adaptor subunit [Steroidobacteraceae bacterium]